MGPQVMAGLAEARVIRVVLALLEVLVAVAAVAVAEAVV